MASPRLTLVLFILAATTAVFGQTSSGTRPQPETGPAPEPLRQIREIIRQAIDRGEFAGINLSIARNDRVVFSESFGFQDREAGKPMQAETIFRIASMTKPIVSAAVMMFYDEGRFHLDDPVARHIPAFSQLKVLAKEDGDPQQLVEPKSPMTIRQLLTHTSGLPKGYRTAPTDTLADWAPKLATAPLLHQPGQDWRYAESINLLGYLVEVWSHQPLDAFLEERIFQPLGMKDTAFYVPVEKAGRVGKLYTTDKLGQAQPQPNQPDPTRRPVFLSGSGGLYSTTADYLQFCRMLLNGGELDGKRLLRRTTVDLMFQAHVPPEVITPNGPGERKGYGFGLGAAILVDGAAAEIAGTEGEFTWGGAHGTLFWVDRKNNVAGLWMLQQPPSSAPGQRFHGYREFKSLTYQALAPK